MLSLSLIRLKKIVFNTLSRIICIHISLLAVCSNSCFQVTILKLKMSNRNILPMFIKFYIFSPHNRDSIINCVQT